MKPTFRIATVSNLNTVMEFVQEFYESDHAHMTFDQDSARAALEQILQDDSLGRVWLIDWGEEAIGYVILTLGYSLEYRGRDAFVDELFIRDRFRGRGIGTKTLQVVEKACASLGVQALHLEVEQDNTLAQSFYRKCGFKDHQRYLMTKSVCRDN